MTTRRFPKLVPVLCAAALSFGALACGDDDDDDDDDIVYDATPAPDADTTDADTTDAAVPDAAPVSTRSGSISIVDTTLINDVNPANWWRGALVDISMVKYPPDVLPAYNDLVPPGIGCSATVYDLAGGDTFATQEDEGAITVADTESPLGPCAHNALAGEYLCVAGFGATAAGDLFQPNHDDPGAGDSLTANVTIAGATFDMATQSEAGMWISLTGFSDPTAGAGDLDPFNGEFPVLAVASANTVVVGFPAAVALPDGTTAGGTFAVVSGAGPTPANVAFLDDAAVVKVSKAAGAETDAFTDSEVLPGGKGFVPSTATIGNMTAFPIDATAAVDFSCAGAGGNCGTAQGTIIVISATDGDVSGDTTGAAMPEGDEWVSVSCRQFGDTVSLPLDVVDLIEAIGPTRIRVSMFRANLGLEGNEDGTNQVGIVAGFGYVTFTTL